MAKDEIEIEIKIPTNKRTFGKVKQYLKKHAKLVGRSQEVDKYYNSPHRNFLEPKHPEEYLRIRTKGGGGAVTYKKVYFNNKTGWKTHADEYESRVENAGQLEKIFSVLDFNNFLTINKQRERFESNDKFEIALDIVKGLGYFVEIEAMKNYGSRSTTYNKVADFAKVLGLDPKKQDNDGYVLMMMKKKGLVKD